jgi:Protein of unknown function (DUF3617)
MKKLILLAPCIALLSACGGGAGGGSAVALQPGQWEMVTQVTGVEAPGAPPAVVEQMRAAAQQQPQRQNRCLTPQEAANPSAGLMNAGQASGCNFTEQTFSGGTIRVVGTCQAPGGQGSVATRMEGTYTATTMTATVTADITMGAGAPPGAPRSIRSTATLNGRRTGDCPAGG